MVKETFFKESDMHKMKAGMMDGEKEGDLDYQKNVPCLI